MSYIWQTLIDVDGGGEFLDANFQLAPHSHMQQNREESVPNAPTSQTPTEVRRESSYVVEEMVVDSESEYVCMLIIVIRLC